MDSFCEYGDELSDEILHLQIYELLQNGRKM
jgi:hypothetical protein